MKTHEVLTFRSFRCEFCIEVEGIVHNPGDGRFEGWGQLALVQHFPVNRREERVLLDVLDTVTCNT